MVGTAELVKPSVLHLQLLAERIFTEGLNRLQSYSKKPTRSSVLAANSSSDEKLFCAGCMMHCTVLAIRGPPQTQDKCLSNWKPHRFYFV